MEILKAIGITILVALAATLIFSYFLVFVGLFIILVAVVFMLSLCGMPITVSKAGTRIGVFKYGKYHPD